VYRDHESWTNQPICSICSRHDAANREDCHITVDAWLHDYRLIGNPPSAEAMQRCEAHVLRIRFVARDDARHIYYVKVDGQQRVEDVKHAYRAAGLDCD
jgi:hypothetical protein